MNRKLKLLIVLAIDLLVAILILRNVRSHAPVQSGSAAEFWMVACDIDVDGAVQDFNYFGGVYPPRGTWAVYYIQGYHDQFLYRVRLSELVPYLPKVERELKDDANRAKMQPWLVNASNQWTRESADVEEVRELLALMRREYLTSLRERDEASYASEKDDEYIFYERWRRANRYWATVLFEFLWLSLVLVLAAVPWIRKSGRLGWATHLGLTCPVLFVPFFLGYVPYAFTSAFPAGGVYYPYVITWFRGLPLFGADIWLLEHAPQPFEPLTQTPGPMLAITGMGLVGPIAVCAVGVIVFASAYAFAATGDFLKSRSYRPNKAR